MRSITTLLKLEIENNKVKTRETLVRIRRNGERVAHPNDICDALDALPALLEILASLQIAEDFNLNERYWASYAFSYLIFKEDYIPDTTNLEIGYLDDLCIIVQILHGLYRSGEPRRFERYKIAGEDFGSWISRVNVLAPHMVPAVTYEKIKELTSLQEKTIGA